MIDAVYWFLAVYISISICWGLHQSLLFIWTLRRDHRPTPVVAIILFIGMTIGDYMIRWPIHAWYDIMALMQREDTDE